MLKVESVEIGSVKDDGVLLGLSVRHVVFVAARRRNPRRGTSIRTTHAGTRRPGQFPAKTLEARSRRSGTERLGEGEATAGHHNSLALVHAQAVKQAPYARHRSDRLRDHVDEVMGSHRHLALAVRCAWRTLFCYRKDFVLAVAHRQRVESRVSMSR
ncbi:hypothetical protein PC128_g17823 [Phytophthora cactorum]|nr:hypothetical protein PC128_g17823 [Phytophthora cactorum]